MFFGHKSLRFMGSYSHEELVSLKASERHQNKKKAYIFFFLGCRAQVQAVFILLCKYGTGLLCIKSVFTFDGYL